MPTGSFESNGHQANKNAATNIRRLLETVCTCATSPFGLPPFGLVGWSRFRAVLMLLSAYPQQPPASMAPR